VRARGFDKALGYFMKALQLKMSEELIWFSDFELAELAELYSDVARCFQALGDSRDAAL